MRVATAFGEVDIPDEVVLHFPAGIYGFPQLRRGCLLPYGATSGLRWLQSLDEPSLVFLTVEPYLVFPGYEADLPEYDAEALELTAPSEAAIVTLVTISAESEAVTTNLLAPIVINTRTRCARQIVLDSDCYLTRHLIGGEIKDDFHAGLSAEDW
jgi:flagellar assembly factor FliW